MAKKNVLTPYEYIVCQVSQKKRKQKGKKKKDGTRNVK